MTAENHEIYKRLVELEAQLKRIEERQTGPVWLDPNDPTRHDKMCLCNDCF